MNAIKYINLEWFCKYLRGELGLSLVSKVEVTKERGMFLVEPEEEDGDKVKKNDGKEEKESKLVELLVVKEHLVVVVGDGIQHGDSILDGVQNDQEPLLCGILVVVKFRGVSERNGKEDVDGNIEQFPLKLCSSEGRDSQEGMEEIDEEMDGEEAAEDDGVDLDLVGDVDKAPSAVVLGRLNAVEGEKLVPELDHVEKVSCVEGKRTILQEVGVHESRQGDRGHYGAGPSHQAQEVEDYEADLS